METGSQEREKSLDAVNSQLRPATAPRVPRSHCEWSRDFKKQVIRLIRRELPRDQDAPR